MGGDEGEREQRGGEARLTLVEQADEEDRQGEQPDPAHHGHRGDAERGVPVRGRQRPAALAGRRLHADPPGDPGAAGDRPGDERRIEEDEGGKRHEQHEQIDVAEDLHVQWAGGYRHVSGRRRARLHPPVAPGAAWTCAGQCSSRTRARSA